MYSATLMHQVNLATQPARYPQARHQQTFAALTGTFPRFANVVTMMMLHVVCAVSTMKLYVYNQVCCLYCRNPLSTPCTVLTTGIVSSMHTCMRMFAAIHATKHDAQALTLR